MNFPQPVNNKSENNADIIFYLCQELVDVWGPQSLRAIRSFRVDFQ